MRHHHTWLGILAAVGAAAIPVSSVAAPASRILLLNDRELAHITGNVAAIPELAPNCGKLIDYVAQPMEVLALDPHYTDKGVSTSKNNGKQLSADARASYKLALCYLTTRDARYAATAQRILDAWAKTLKSVTTDQGKDNINFDVPYMIIAASWVRSANRWDSSSFDRFLRAVVVPNTNSANPNNHGEWGVLLEASAAAYLGDAQLLDRARTRWGTLLEGAATADGILTREVERSGTTNWRGGPDKGIKGLAYTHYFLLPATLSAKIFDDAGKPVWSTKDGKLFGLVFAHAAAWTRHPETFPYYASNNGKLEGVRNDSYFVLLNRYYPNADAAAVLKDSDVGADGFMLADLFP